MSLIRERKIGARIAIILSLLMCFLVVPDLNVNAAPIPGVISPCYVAMDADTGEILADLNADVVVFPASTTKLVTAMVICDVLPLDRVIVVSQSALDKVTPSSTKVGLVAGGEYTVAELLEMVLISSAADAVEVLVEASYGNDANFVAMMNKKVQSLGLVATQFDNAIGLDIGDGYANIHTTAREFAVITQAANRYDWIRFVTGVGGYQVGARTNNAEITRFSTNQFLNGKKAYTSDVYQVTGTKTGTTKAAGSVLAATATNGSRTVICVCFCNPNSDVLYTSVEQIYNTVFAN